ncbi:MAG: response regulator [Planctomycetota bacterium]|jgi:CheY-like chemotaxis protein
MTGKKILIVDTDRDYLSRLAAGLVAEDYDILTAQDVLQAVEAFRTHAPDLVIVSLKLPGGGGGRVHEHVKRVGHFTVPVIYLATGLSGSRTSLLSSTSCSKTRCSVHGGCKGKERYGCSPSMAIPATGSASGSVSTSRAASWSM